MADGIGVSVQIWIAAGYYRW